MPTKTVEDGVIDRALALIEPVLKKIHRWGKNKPTHVRCGLPFDPARLDEIQVFARSTLHRQDPNRLAGLPDDELGRVAGNLVQCAYIDARRTATRLKRGGKHRRQAIKDKDDDTYWDRRRDADPLDKCCQHEICTLVTVAMTILSFRDQLVLRLLHWEEMTQPEAAAILCMTAGALNGIANRARRRLKEYLEKSARSALGIDALVG